jgi:hypothetical protein
MVTLFEKLIAVGLPIESASETGEVSGLPGVHMTVEQTQLLSDICYEHLHPLEYAVMVRVRNRLTEAKVTAKAVPNWATWTQMQWAAYRDANVSSTQINAITSLADAKAMLNKMAVVLDSLAKMEIALRDQVWPDLPE